MSERILEEAKAAIKLLKTQREKKVAQNRNRYHRELLTFQEEKFKYILAYHFGCSLEPERLFKPLERFGLKIVPKGDSKWFHCYLTEYQGREDSFWSENGRNYWLDLQANFQVETIQFELYAETPTKWFLKTGDQVTPVNFWYKVPQALLVESLFAEVLRTVESK